MDLKTKRILLKRHVKLFDLVTTFQYEYCLYNPLILTDPSGEFYIIADGKIKERIRRAIEELCNRLLPKFGLISQRRGNASYFYHYDGLGSTKALTDANRNIQASYVYDAWGNVLQTSGTVTNPYLYVGELGYYGDGDSGMYLLTQRWYNPVVGRFVVKDRLYEERNENLYIYTLNNSPNRVDPKGTISIGAMACILCGAIIDIKGVGIILGCYVGCKDAIFNRK